jgi:IS605 OrfB family transposase
MDDMKLVVQTQLLPDATQAAKLKAIVERFNATANVVAGVAFEQRTANVFELRRLCYAEVRERFGLSSQMAQLAIKAARDAYCRDKSIRPRFRKHAAIAYDQRTMSFKGIDRVSLLTLEGRVVVPFILGKYQADRMTLKKGQSDLVLRKDGKWFLIVTVDVPDGALVPATDFIGVDLGIANLVTDSDGGHHSGKPVETVRRKHNLQRKRLQRKGTKGAKKKLKRTAAKESRFRRHENHCIAKTIVQAAKRTGRGIALEDLTGIRERVTARGGDARNRLGGWGFAQLGGFIGYKAQAAGVPVVHVDPRYTSQTCAQCGHRERSNRKSQSEFRCQACGHEAHADVNAARNVRYAALVQAGALAVPCNAATGLDSPSGLSRKAAGL